MTRPKIYTEEERKQKKKEYNNLPEQKERRRINAIKYYYKNKADKINKQPEQPLEEEIKTDN